MVAEHLRMVGGEDHQRVVPLTARLDGVEDAAELGVHFGDHAVIGGLDLPQLGIGEITDQSGGGGGEVIGFGEARGRSP